jgi:hypothetical protein
MEPGRAGGASPARVSRLARAEPKILVPVIRHRSGAVRVAGARPRPLPRARAVGIKGREAGMHPSWNPDALEARARRRLRPRTTRDWARVSRMARAEPKVLVPVIRHRPGVVRVARARPRPPPRSRTVDTKGLSSPMEPGSAGGGGPAASMAAPEIGRACRAWRGPSLKILVTVIRHRPGAVRVTRARPRPPPRARAVGSGQRAQSPVHSGGTAEGLDPSRTPRRATRVGVGSPTLRPR